MNDYRHWKDAIGRSYINYLRTSFFFKDKGMRASFHEALEREGELIKGPFDEPARNFETGISADALSREFFGDSANNLTPALMGAPTLYAHQEDAVRKAFGQDRNIVVATGTASGKTECFIYPALFDLYRQHQDGVLSEPGVRTMIIYPMNALANDQRQRLGDICKALQDAGSEFEFTFGQYTGQTPENERDRYRDGEAKWENRQPGELVFREQMRASPPHILLTNYSMLEYLLIRPSDSRLFDNGIGKHWRFIVLDEAHLHRGAQGAEMGMLMRRLKQRVSEGGRKDGFNCIATSATISSSQSFDDQQEVAEFANALFGEPFTGDDIIFGKTAVQEASRPSRSHLFVRGLESAFLLHEHGKDRVVLNRTSTDDGKSVPIEIALCKDCGQHYYIGQERGGELVEAVRDPSMSGYGVTYFMPSESGDDTTHIFCRRCAKITEANGFGLTCECNAPIAVKLCESDKNNPDQIDECGNCGYRRGGYRDPVQEIVHGADGPNAVIATALHQLLPEERRKILTFADSRQEAAFFAWYVEDTYNTIASRNAILRAMREHPVDAEGLKASDLANRLLRQSGGFAPNTTTEERRREALLSVWGEALTEERRLSLSGVGLVKWFVQIPEDFVIPKELNNPPWQFGKSEAHEIISYLLGTMIERYAVATPDAAGVSWDLITQRPQRGYKIGSVGRVKNVSIWGQERSAPAQNLARLAGVSASAAQKLMETVWHAIRDYDKKQSAGSQILLRVPKQNNAFRLNPEYVRVNLVDAAEIWECDTCAGVSAVNIRDACFKVHCKGRLVRIDNESLVENHYRILYEQDALPRSFRAEEHTAQIDTEKAKDRQDEFKAGDINLLSSSTTFEVGVDLGDLDVAFLRNIPPESFNYAQRVGRVGRREHTGFAISYCRRSPHDLYHFENPEQRVMQGVTRPPLMRLENKKIVLRHMASLALGRFFKHGSNGERFTNVSAFIGKSDAEELSCEMKSFCTDDSLLEQALEDIVPDSHSLHQSVGLSDKTWIDNLFGRDSRFYDSVAGVLKDIAELEIIQQRCVDEKKFREAARISRRLNTILEESTLNFLSRSAILPKYGFPVDTVEMEVKGDRRSAGNDISLQRDLSQAISEYAPGSQVIANKKVWESGGVNLVQGKQPVPRFYRYDDEGNFEHAHTKEEIRGRGVKQYFTPQWGFATDFHYRPKEPVRKTQRLYTTRPFFGGFADDREPESRLLNGVNVTVAVPGRLYILSEGHQKKQFHVCLTCGRHSAKRSSKHKTLYGTPCGGKMGKYSYGYELATDVVRLMFPYLDDVDDAYSLAYALALGSADTLGAPQSDLNVALSRIERPSEFGSISIILYDDVPGGAGFVARLSRENIFAETLDRARERVNGGCGCDTSCYGCLRSYRNQFMHSKLNRKVALQFINEASGNLALSDSSEDAVSI